MYLFRSFVALAVPLIYTLLCPLVNAHSSPAKPLRRIAHPSTIALEILPRQTNLNNSKRQLDSTTLRYDDSFRLIISAFDTYHYLHLRPNDHLVHPAARVNYYRIGVDGQTYISHSDPIIRESVRAYWGEVIDATSTNARMRQDAAGVVPQPHPSTLGWARIMVHDQGSVSAAPRFEGAFSVKGDVYHIMTRENYLRHKDPIDPDVSVSFDDDSSLVIWRESDMMTAQEEHHARTAYNTDPNQNIILQKPLTNSWFNDPFAAFTNNSFSKRQDGIGAGMGTNYIDNIGSTAGCPLSQKVLYMGVAADCNYVAKYGSQENATTQILTSWNSASALYKTTFNISLGIIELQIQPPSCPSSIDANFPWNTPCSQATLDNRLSIFSQWRGDKGDDDIGLWHLMTTCITDSEVGVAWLATVCQQTAAGKAPSVVSGTAVSTAGKTEWVVVAHEIGHNFGAIHDCTSGCSTNSPCCPLTTSSCDANAQFIMSPVAQPGEKVFSACSVGNICSLMTGANKVQTSCLVDPNPNRLPISLQMCGNGIVERGEDCDPGRGLESICCDSATCKFKNNAVCDPDSSQCCTAQCSFAPATQVCRAAKDNRCDTTEMCTGNSSTCPPDITAPNGRSCGSNELRCASGQCTSISQQCRTVGAAMNFQNACPPRGDRSCQLACEDPSRSNQCTLLSATLIDGSPCGYGGSCSSGRCQSGGVLDTVKAWYTQNLQISIPATILAGLALLLILWAIIRAVRRCIARRKQPAPPVFIPTMMGSSAAIPTRPKQARHHRLVSGDGHQRLPSIEQLPQQFGSADMSQNRPSSFDRAASVRSPPQALRPGRGSSPRDRLVEMDTYDTNPATRGESRSNWVDESMYNGRSGLRE